jgi:hypothetical protein
VTEIEESILPHQVLRYLFQQITMVMQIDYGGKNGDANKFDFSTSDVYEYSIANGDAHRYIKYKV